jgi:peptide/nickel transport system permease protein
VLSSFILLKIAPGDPVDRILQGQGIYESDVLPGTPNEKIKNEIKQKLGLNLPVFYVSFAEPNESPSSINASNSWKKYLPILNFHTTNQFHRWLFGDGTFSKGIIRGDFGNSWVSNQPVSDLISSRIGWSLFFTFFSVLLAYVISVPAGLKAASNPGSAFDKRLSLISTILFSLPAFWVATVLMLLFCNPDVFNFLPSSGVGPAGGFDDNNSPINIFINTLPHMILPLICFTYSSFAFLSGSIKSSIIEILREDYIRTAYAKGLDDRRILKKHAFRNALLPMITLFSQVFPAAIGGSVILETVFTIPGMGLAIYQGVAAQDYPLVITVFLLTGVITMLSFLLSDILYAIVDPRISYIKSN